MDEEAIVCRGVSRRFGTRWAISGLDLSVPRGHVFGFLGPNGAGKTTMVRMLIGMLRPTTGSVRVLGRDPVAQGDEVRALCGVMLDNVGLYERLSAYQNLLFAARVARLSPKEQRQRVDEALRRVDLWERRYDRVSGFSKGMRQKLGLARALIHDPELLILDEPTAGLDPANIVRVRELLVSLAEESGRTIFLSTHLLDEAQRVCDRVAIIQQGRLLVVGEPNKLGTEGIPTVRLTLTGMEGGEEKALALPEGIELAPLGGREWRARMRDLADTESLVKALVHAGIGVRAVIPEAVSLEEEYLRLVGGNNP
ncbi:MAG: ABC transporter ATP-binding protein [Firmicutes bacterium]|nr:ABC transporter ATP-binding protein [Bacillota bacterium]